MAGGAYQLRSELLGPLPVINHFLGRMGLDESLERFVPHDDARLRLAPAVVLGVVVRNLVTHRQPVYAMSEWAGPYDSLSALLVGHIARRKIAQLGGLR